jgi:CBS domain-containing protein
MPNAREIMSKDVVTVTTESRLQELAETFVETGYSTIPVLDEKDNLVGIISETDLVEQQKPLHIPTVVALFDWVLYLESQKNFKDEVDRITATTVGQLCRKNPVTCSPDDDVRTLAGLMSKHKVHLLPVMEAGQMIGVVGRLDLIRTMEM